jgi:hypothetical protein
LPNNNSTTNTMRSGYILTEKEASEIILLLNYAQTKLPDGKQKTMAQNLYKKYTSIVTERYTISQPNKKEDFP